MRILFAAICLLWMSDFTLAENPAPKLDPLELLRAEENLQTTRTLVSQCEEPGFRSAVGIELDRRALAAATAVESLALPPCKAGVRYIDQFWWETTDVIELEWDQYGFTIASRLIAVESDGSTTRLDCGYCEDPLAGLAEFNRVSATQDVKIDDEEDAARYLAFFLYTFLRGYVSYLPGAEVIELISKRSCDFQLYDSFEETFMQIDYPVVQIVGADSDGFRGTAYRWLGCKTFERYDLTVSSAGAVTFERQRLVN